MKRALAIALIAPWLPYGLTASVGRWAVRRQFAELCLRERLTWIDREYRWPEEVDRARVKDEFRAVGALSVNHLKAVAPLVMHVSYEFRYADTTQKRYVFWYLVGATLLPNSYFSDRWESVPISVKVVAPVAIISVVSTWLACVAAIKLYRRRRTAS